MNAVQVDEVYTSGTVEQLQKHLQVNDKSISIGGGRFSMRGRQRAKSHCILICVA